MAEHRSMDVVAQPVFRTICDLGGREFGRSPALPSECDRSFSTFFIIPGEAHPRPGSLAKDIWKDQNGTT